MYIVKENHLFKWHNRSDHGSQNYPILHVLSNVSNLVVLSQFGIYRWFTVLDIMPLVIIDQEQENFAKITLQKTSAIVSKNPMKNVTKKHDP